MEKYAEKGFGWEQISKEFLSEVLGGDVQNIVFSGQKMFCHRDGIEFRISIATLEKKIEEYLMKNTAE